MVETDVLERERDPVDYYNESAEKVDIDVPFGPKPHQKITLEWAESGLRWLYEQRREVFGSMMLAIVEADRERAPRGRKGE